MSTFPPESFLPSNPVDLYIVSVSTIAHPEDKARNSPDEELYALSFRSISVSLSLLILVDVGSFVVGSRGGDELVKVRDGVGEDDIDTFESFFDRSDIVVIDFAEFDVGDTVEQRLGGCGLGRSSAGSDLIASFGEGESNGSTCEFVSLTARE